MSDAPALSDGAGRGLRPGWARTARGRLAGHRPQLQGSFWLTVAVGITAVGGFAFWLVAARRHPEADVGRVAALFTAVQFLIYAAGLGLPVGIARYAPDRSSRSARIFAWAVLATALGGAAAAALVLVVLPDDVAAASGPASAGPLTGAVFVVTVVGVNLGVLVEVRLLSLRRWGLVVGRAAVVAVGRLPLVLWVPGGAAGSARWLFFLVAVVPALSGLALLALVLAADRDHRLRPIPSTFRAFARFARVNYVGTLALLAPQFVLPLLVSLYVAPEEMAAYYVAFSVAVVVFLIPQTLAQVLLAEGGKDERDPRSQLKLGLLLGVGVASIATVVLAVGSGGVTAVYGGGYAVTAEVLPWLVGAGIPWSVTCMVLAGARLVEDRVAILGITVTAAVAILGPAVLLVPDHGVGGATVAWVTGNLLTAVVAVLLALRVVPRLRATDR